MLLPEFGLAHEREVLTGGACYVTVAALALAAVAMTARAQTGTIVDLVIRDPNLALLKDAVIAGGLVETRALKLFRGSS